MPDAKHPGRPPADPTLGVMTGLERQRWYRKRQTRRQRGMAVLGLDL